MQAQAPQRDRHRTRTGPVFAPRADESTDEDHFVADNFADSESRPGWSKPACRRNLAAAAPTSTSLPRCCAPSPIIAARPRSPSPCTPTRSPFRPGAGRIRRPTPVEPLLKRIATGAHPAAVERRLGLDRRLRQGREGRGRLPHHRAQDLHLRRAHRRPADDQRRARNRRRAAMVLHFGVPMNSPHVKVLDTWRTLGMRGTGSHDVLIDGHVVPEAAVAREAQGRRMAPAVPHHCRTIAFPLVYSVYLGVAESARDHCGRAGEAQEARPSHHRALPAAWRRSWPRRVWRREIDAGSGAPQRAIGRDRQSGDDRAATGAAPRHRGGGIGDGDRGRRRASIARPAWSGGSATSRPRAIIRCNRVRRPNTPAQWRWGFQSTRSTDASKIAAWAEAQAAGSLRPQLPKSVHSPLIP